MNDEAEGTGELGLECGDVDLAVALARVAVACFEVGAFGVDGDEEGGARDKLFVVHITGVHPRWGGVGFAAGCGRDAHAAKEGMERNSDAGREVGEHLVTVKPDDFGAGVGEVVRKEAAPSTEGVACPGNVNLDLLDTDFEDVAGFGFSDSDGAGEDMAAGAFVGCGKFGVDVTDVLRDFGGGNAERFEALGRAAGGEGLHADGIA